MDLKNRLFVLLPFIIAIFFGFGIFLGSKINFSQSGNPQAKKVFNFPKSNSSKLNDIINYIDNEYVDEVERETLVDKAITTILQELDPHSYYISAAEIKALSEPLEGSFEGIGVQFSIQKDTVVVINPVNGGPSEKVGVMAGDRIVKVNKELIAGNGISNRKVMNLLKGEKGTEVNIKVLRNTKDTIGFKIIRDKIPIYSLDVAYMLNENTGYIKLSRFSKNTYEEFLEAGIKLKNQGMQKMILDLRGNGGGFMDAATNIIDEFLPKNTLMVYTEGRARPKQSFYATDKSTFVETELAILIDEGSASASEIIAGAIQDNDRGVIIGRRSFGKGLVQEQSSWNDGSATRLTIARYYTPSGRCIQKPYEDGIAHYQEDYQERLENGELYSDINITLNDSLKYSTKNGREVYGGGGIMPDEFIPVDTVGGSFYLSELVYKGVFYQFAFEYADKHREELTALGDYKKFVSFYNQIKNKVVAEFVEYAKEQGIDKNEKSFNRSKQRIEDRLRAQIARNIWDDAAFYPLWNEADQTIKEALKILGNPTKMAILEIAN
jgi:carboxyl-terminal processing protease